VSSSTYAVISSADAESFSVAAEFSSATAAMEVTWSAASSIAVAHLRGGAGVLLDDLAGLGDQRGHLAAGGAQLLGTIGDLRDLLAHRSCGGKDALERGARLAGSGGAVADLGGPSLRARTSCPPLEDRRQIEPRTIA
jgi:hypothetical protein